MMKVDRRAWRGSKNEQRAWQEFRKICKWIIYIKIYIGVLGAAILGASGAGIFESLQDAVDTMVHPTEMITPNMENYKMYTDMYEIFRDAFLAWRDKDIYNRLNTVCEKYWN